MSTPRSSNEARRPSYSVYGSQKSKRRPTVADLGTDDYLIVKKRRSAWPIILVCLRLLQLGFAVLVLAVTATYLYTAPDTATQEPATCRYFLQIKYPSDGPNPVYSSLSFEDGNVMTCEYAISVAAIAIFFSLVYLIDVLVVMMDYHIKGRALWLRIIETIIILSIAILWTAGAIWTAIGYVSTCTDGRCDLLTNAGAFVYRSQTLVAVIFTWLSIVPWAVDAGLLLRYHWLQYWYGQDQDQREELTVTPVSSPPPPSPPASGTASTTAGGSPRMPV